MGQGKLRSNASNAIEITSWATFKTYIDGTVQRRGFVYEDTADAYVIVTDDGGSGWYFTHTITKAGGTPPGGSDEEDFVDNFASEAGQLGLVGVALHTTDGTPLSSTLDQGVQRLQIIGKVQVTGAITPPATTSVAIYGDNPLTVGTDDTTFTIPNGETFFLQEIVAGNEDPTKGATVEVLYDNGTEHLVARIYIAGTTLAVGYPDRDEARDGTAMVGNGSHSIIVRRTKFSGTNIAIDAVVRGYTQ